MLGLAQFFGHPALFGMTGSVCNIISFACFRSEPMCSCKHIVNYNKNVRVSFALSLCGRQEPQCAVFLLKRGAQCNAANKKGRTPLHIAASKGFFSLTQVLLDNGADLHLKVSFFSECVCMCVVYFFFIVNGIQTEWVAGCFFSHGTLQDQSGYTLNLLLHRTTTATPLCTILSTPSMMK